MTEHDLITAIRTAVAALDDNHVISDTDRAATNLRLTLLTYERDCLTAQLTQAWDDLAGARSTIDTLRAALADALCRETRAQRWVRLWKRAAKRQRGMGREIEAAVDRRDERIRKQDATITTLWTELAAARNGAHVEHIPPIPPDHPSLRKRCAKCTQVLPRDAYSPAAWERKGGICRACKAAQNKRDADVRRHRQDATPAATNGVVHAPHAAPKPAAKADIVAAAWADERAYVCPVCGGTAFTRALNQDCCMRCAHHTRSTPMNTPEETSHDQFTSDR